MPRLSCIIPVIGDVRLLEATLVSVLANRPDDCEILVVLGTPYDDPYNLASEVTFLAAGAGAGYVGCANLGVRASAAPIVHVLSAGMEVTEGWADAALEPFRDPTVAAVAPVARSTSCAQRASSAGVAYARGGRRIVCTHIPGSAAMGPLGPDAAAAFYRKSTLVGLGGLPEELADELADVDFALTLRAAGWRTVVESRAEVLEPVAAGSAPRRRGYEYGRSAEQLFWRNLPRGSRAAALVAHVATILAEALRAGRPLTGLAQLAGRLAALRSLSACAAHRRQLEALQATAAAPPQPDEAAAGQPRRIDAAHPASRSSTLSTVAARRR